jgi:hypothetical protein
MAGGAPFEIGLIFRVPTLWFLGKRLTCPQLRTDHNAKSGPFAFETGLTYSHAGGPAFEVEV